MNLIGIRTNKRSKWSGIVGWNFVMPAALLIIVFRFVPMFNALLLSLQSGKGNNLTFSGFNNFSRLFSDKVFMTSVGNTLLYLVIQVPVMLLLALILASLLNNPKLVITSYSIHYTKLYETMRTRCLNDSRIRSLNITF